MISSKRVKCPDVQNKKVLSALANFLILRFRYFSGNQFLYIQPVLLHAQSCVRSVN